MPLEQAAASFAAKIGCLVIDRRVECEFVLSHTATLLRSACDAYGPGTGELRKLADERPYGPLAAATNDSFVGAGLPITCRPPYAVKRAFPGRRAPSSLGQWQDRPCEFSASDNW